MAVEPVFTERKKLNFFSPPASLQDSNSAEASLGSAHNAPAPAGFVQDKTGAAPAPAPQYTPQQRMGFAAQSGLQAAGQIQATESGLGAASQVLGSAASGAAMGTAILPGWGTAIGAGVGALMGGLNAYVGNQSARKERDRINALNAEARRLNAEAIARDEKWRQTYRLDSLEQARYERQKYEAQAAFDRAQKQGQSMMAQINANSVLKERFAKFGWA